MLEPNMITRHSNHKFNFFLTADHYGSSPTPGLMALEKMTFWDTPLPYLT